ncbi:MAG: hypothetical protein Q7T82_15000 [Armatimonadota bacterium]|nr:hypothetical protein [Armatimonadota bacterium]
MQRPRTNRREADESYVHAMGRVLRNRDVEALRRFLARSAQERDDPGEAAEIEGIPQADLESRMHKMIMARMDLQDLHDESRQWLIEHGFKPLRRR